MPRIYIGNLPLDVTKRDVEDLFSKYGKISNIDVKIPPRRPAYAFVEYDDIRDAEDAVRGRDGFRFEGEQLRVEISHGRSMPPPFHSQHSQDPRRTPSRRSDFRVLVTGLPPTGSWQDLKDHMRKAGDVCFSDVSRDGTGVIEYTRHEDMKYALERLNETEFRSHKGETSTIRIREERSRGRSPSPRRRSPSPRRRSPSPRRRSPSPRRRSPSPRGRSASPRGASPNGRSPPPRDRAHSPQRSSLSPSRN